MGAPALFGSTSAGDLVRPNIVFMVVEDLGPRIGAYGDPLAKTPHIDQLAAEGVRFTNMFTTSGVCAPSRAALVTGMHQQAIGAQHMRASSFGRSRSGALGTFSTPGPPYEAVPPGYVKAFPELLRAAGYFTMNNTKTDYQFGEPVSVWDRIGDQVGLNDRDPDKPFFLMLSNNTTHESGLFRAGYANKLAHGDEIVARNNRRLAKLDRRTDPEQVEVPAYLPDTPEVRKDLAQHYDNIALMDRWVGDRVAEFRIAGLLENTLVVWTSDHGDGLPRAKRTLYDSGLRVPLIIRFPNRTHASSVDARLLSFVDLAPTFLALAGVPVPDHMHGRDLLNSATSPRRYVYAARDRLDELPDRSRAVRDMRFKYIRNYLPERQVLGPLYFRENLASMSELRRLYRDERLPPEIAWYLEPKRPSEELYDLADDPDELHNLAGVSTHNSQLRRLRAELNRWLHEIGDMSTQPEVDMVTQQMWPDGKQPLTAEPIVIVDCSDAMPRVAIQASTPGSSLMWRMRDDPYWSLYRSPLGIAAGANIEIKAVRYGYAESQVVRRSICEIQAIDIE